jgi:chymotrypsin
MALRILLCALCIVFVAAEDYVALEKLFLKAKPLHPVIRPTESKNPPSTQPKVTSNEQYSGAFTPLMDCSGNRTDLKLGDFGTITSPNYPRNYPARVSCEWMIEGPPGTRIQAVLFDSVTQPWFFAYFDYVMIAKNGNFSNVDRLSGDMNAKTPMMIESEANKLGIRFRSSALFNFRGFKLQYLVVPGDEPVPDFEKPVFDGVCGQTLARPELGSTEEPSSSSSSSSTEGMAGMPPAMMPEPIEPVEIAPGDLNMTRARAAGQEHIVGGGEALKYAYPWMVALLIDNKHFCGGSLINKRYVLTAAHCTDRASQITMLLGTHNLKANKDIEDGRKVINITRESIFQHPEYNGNTITYDISLLRLPEDVTFTDRIRPVCLPNRNHIPRFYEDVPTKVSGWGKPADNSAGVSPVLKEADVKVMPNNQCRVAFRGIVTGNLICISTTPKASPCKGDSGGPLMVKQMSKSGEEYYMQLGIVSFGSLTCERAFPVGFTRVSAFLDYINEITGENY